MSTSSTSAPAPAPKSSPLTAYVSFPSPYTQTLLVRALVSTLDSISISLLPPDDDDPHRLQWADYDLLSFDRPHANPNYLISSYVYRKALIRKHQLHLTITEYLAKCRHRGVNSVLADGGVPKGWVVDIQFADELDEALLDDLYELAEGLQANEGKDDGDRQWYILKPGFADRAQGIRMFSTEDELRAIFESFEPPSSDEEDDEDNSQQECETALQMSRLHTDDDETGTGVTTSQLRHFVIQEYSPRPVLFDLDQEPHGPLTSTLGHKFHLRAYVLLSGAYQLYLSRTMLALFSGEPYDHPSSAPGDVDRALRPHLTNTCLQTDEFGAPIREESLVKVFWKLEGLSALRLDSTDAEDQGRVTRAWLDETFAKTGEVVHEAIKAGVECGSFGLQLMPNAFEIFGVDLLVSFPPGAPALSTPTVTLLEFNASPDFQQSGNRLQGELLEMFQGVVREVIGPFFGMRQDEGDEAPAWNVGEERCGWRKIGQGAVRGPTV